MSSFAKRATHFSTMRIAPPVALLSLVITLLLLPSCNDRTVAESATGPITVPAEFATSQLLPDPITIVPLTGRHAFTDDVAVQVRDQPAGRPTTVGNMKDASNMAVLRITVQPGARFPWHTHPGPVLVAVTQGEFVYVYADDCVERPYPAGKAFVDPGFGNVHFGFNPTGGETVVIATFLNVPDVGPLTIPVDAAQAAQLDAKCGFSAASHSH